MFKKAKNEQGSLTINIYGEAGSGKSFTALLIAEGLAKQCGKRIAVIENEKGFEFYADSNDKRKVHKEAFDFDIVRTKSIFDATKAANEAIKSDEYGVVIVDSVTGYYDAAKKSWTGKMNSNGAYPMYAWNTIYRRYDDLIMPLLDCGKHVIFCGRMGNLYSDGEDSQMKVIGKRMKTKGDQAYETNILFQMTPITKDGKTDYALFVEKNRSSVLTGETIMWPTFENTVGKIIPLLGKEHKNISSSDDREEFIKKEFESKKIFDSMSKKISNCKNKEELESIRNELSSNKPNMITEHVSELSVLYNEKLTSFDVKANDVLNRIK